MARDARSGKLLARLSPTLTRTSTYASAPLLPKHAGPPPATKAPAPHCMGESPVRTPAGEVLGRRPNQPFEPFIFIKAKVRPSRDRVGALPGGACIRPARRPSEGIVKRDVVHTSFHSRESSIAFSFRLLD